MPIRILTALLLVSHLAFGQKPRARDFGIEIGILPTGEHNSLTDVEGTLVGHITLIEGADIRTGVTSILPHNANIYQEKVPAAIYLGNGYGKLMGYSQVEELGNLESPIMLTNTLSVPTAANAIIEYSLNQPGNENVRSINPLVGETNDGYLNDIRGLHIQESHVIEAIDIASDGPVEEGNVGAGTGTICFGFKGGIGSASRKLPPELGGYTIGVLVQTNFGGVLTIDGIPIDKELDRYRYKDILEKKSDGSCMIVVATDAPIDARNLKRVAKRAFLGLGRTGGIASNGSGDYIIAFSTNEQLRIKADQSQAHQVTVLKNQAMTPIFLATIEATEEAIINSLLAASSMTGFQGRRVEELPKDQLKTLLERYKR